MAAISSLSTPGSPLRTGPWALCFVSLSACFLALGCQKEPDIKEQDVVRFAGMQRMIAAVVLPSAKSESAWIFKLMGPELAVGGVKPQFEAFLRKLRFADEQPDWKQIELPAGWTEGEGDKKKIVKTLHVPAKDGAKETKLDLTVAQIPMGKSPIEDFVPDSLNIWRHQLGLLEVGAEHDFFCERQRIGDSVIYVIDMVGPGGKQAIVADMPDKTFKYDLPKGWQKIRPTSPSQLTLIIEGNKGNAVFTLTQFGGTLEANINRWREQVGLKKLSIQKMAQDKLVNSITVSKLPGNYVDLTGSDTGKGGDRILGVIADDDRVRGQSWFFKLIGPKELLEEHKANFEKFLDSFQFVE